LHGKSLKSLKVCNCGLSAEASKLLSDILHKDGMPKLILFHFYNNMSGDGGAKAVADILSDCPQLEDFRFSATRSMHSGCKAVAEALNKTTLLKKLDLSDNIFGPASGKILAQSLENIPKLTYLNLRDCDLDSEGVEALFDTFGSTDSKIEYLDLSGIYI
jgi:Ran GTPase-activating protein 1